MTAEDAFRKLRNSWFSYHLKSHAHERMWEEEDDMRWREENNKRTKEIFDKQTEEILCGENCCIAPTCCADLDKKGY